MKKSFTDLGINKEIISIIEGIGFKKPTGIQKETIPYILKGRDIIGQAETGSGKTAACAIPIVQMVDRSKKSLQVLVLAPTRELAIQYLEEVSSISKPYGVNSFVVYGGVDIERQMTKLRDGVHILIATPGRLTDIIYNRQFPLNDVKIFVVDEADEMMKMGFIEDIDFIKSCLVQKHQTILFSATMPPPIKKLAGKYLNDYKHIKLTGIRVQPEKLEHFMLSVKSRDKEKALKEFLNKEDITQAIIFCNTRSRVEKLAGKMKKAVKGTDFLHGGLSQNQREKILRNFRQKKTRFIITTDVMARGVDIRNVSHIINYDVTRTPEIYIHRSGRTARMGGEGVSVSFVSSREKEQFEKIKEASDINSDNLNRKKFRGS